MERVFNMGIGLALVVSPYYADSIRHQISAFGYDNWQIGRIVDGPHGVVWG
jgi:phosphoribosylformylglycinamidine cyclo-ligase